MNWVGIGYLGQGRGVKRRSTGVQFWGVMIAGDVGSGVWLSTQDVARKDVMASTAAYTAVLGVFVSASQ